MNKPTDLYGSFFEQFIPTILEGTKNGGGRWPMPIFTESPSVSNFSAPIIISAFMEAIKEIEEKGLSEIEIGKKYHYPSRLARLQHMFVSRYLWSDNLDPKKVSQKFASILSTIYKSNMFCANGKNLIYTSEEIQNKYQNYLEAKDEKLSLEVNRLEKLLYLLSESFSPRFVNSHFEFSGPYPIGAKWIVVKEYHDLRPKFIPIKFTHNFDQITVINVYDQEIDYRVDIMCRPQATNQNLPAPIHSLLFIDDQIQIRPDLISQYRGQIIETMQQSTNYLATLTTKRQIVEFNTGLEVLTVLLPILGEKSYSLVGKALANFDSPEFQTKSDKLNAWIKSIPKNEAGWRKIFDARIKQEV